MTDQSHRKFYNTQDMGLGRALASMGHTVEMYSFIKGDTDETEVFSERLSMHYLHSRSFGFHSLHPCDFITADVDGVICFSDNQLNFKRVVKQCRKQGVVCLPYVGALDSHNASALKKAVLNLFASNMKLYRRMTTLAKTPNVKSQMQAENVGDVVVAPCCLDLSAVNQDYADSDITALRAEIGFLPEHKVILYLARLTDEKHPMEMLDIFKQLYQRDHAYRMISIGKGELQEAFEQKIAELGLGDLIFRLESIENSEVWRFYHMSDVMVNLNRVEIFGMAILEAMYYECPVAARRAPGPEYILTDKKDGFLCDNSEEIIARTEQMCSDRESREKITRAAKDRIMHDFIWQSTAKQMLDMIAEKQKIKILHVLHELHPSGAEMMLYNAKPYWEKECACTVMATGKQEGPFAGQMRARGYETAYVPTVGDGAGAKLAHLKRFWHYMRKHSFDVVHIHRESLSFEYALIAAICGSRKICRTVHSTFAHKGMQRKIKAATRHIMRKLLGVYFIAISDGVASNEQKVFGNICGETIYNWCDNSRFVYVDGEEKKRRKAERGLSDRLTLITVGNCGHVKNHQLLFHAIAEMKQKDRIHYYHVGYAKGETEQEEALSDELGIRNAVEFLGSTQPMPYLKAADLFLMTSIYEGLSIAALEAIFTGMPVLLADVPGLTEFRDKGLCNVSYFTSTPTKLAEALDACVEKYDRGELMPDREQSMRAEELYDCGTQVRKYVRVYRRLTGKREKE